MASSRRQLFSAAAKRLALIPVSLFAVVTIAFGLVALMPGDPAAEVAGQFATQEELQRVRHELGLDDPFLERYADYITSVFRGDLGTSFTSGRPVLDEIGDHLPNTVELVVLSLGLAAVIGVTIGTIGAYYRSRLPDRIGRVVVSAFQSIPDFLLGLLLIFGLYYLWRVLPSPVGRLGISEPTPDRVTGFLFVDALVRGDWGTFRSAVEHAVLPVVTLGLTYSAYLARTARATMSSSLISAQVDFARACGLPERRVLKYAFTTAVGPILTYGAILFGALIGGAAIVEVVFNWQGVGSWAIDSIQRRDVPAIQGFVIVSGFATLLAYLVLDVVVAAIDPRVRRVVE